MCCVGFVWDATFVTALTIEKFIEKTDPILFSHPKSSFGEHKGGKMMTKTWPAIFCRLQYDAKNKLC